MSFCSAVIASLLARFKKPCLGLPWILLVGILPVQQLSAQRVQIPLSTPGAPAPGPSGFDTPQTFAAPSLNAPPPNFDAYTPYSGGSTLGPPPVNSPYTVAPPGSTGLGSSGLGSPVPAYGAPTTAAPGYATPSYPAPNYGGQGFGAPAYGASPYQPSPYGAQDFGVTPYSPTPYSPQPATDGGWLTPDSQPFGWEPGSYQYEAYDGTKVRFKKFLQALSAEYTYLYGDHVGEDFEINRLELSSTFALPLGGNIETPLLLTPGFAFNWLEGPITTPTVDPNLPPRVYDAYLDSAWYPRFSPKFSAELGFRFGVWTDFDHLNNDSIRLLGRGLGVYSVNPQFDILVGAVYLDRVRVKLLPAGGFRFRPADDWDIYLVFPNPKVRKRLASSGRNEWAAYISGEYGGGSWTVDRNGASDRIDYNDIRIMFGLEWETPLKRRGHFEVGYAFDREVRFDKTATPRFTPDSTVLFRAGVDF